MKRQYRYFAVVTALCPYAEDPAGVVRRWIDDEGRTHDESYTHRLAWEPSETMLMIESGRATAGLVPITEEAGLAFEAIQHARAHRFDPVDGKYDYFAWVDGEFTADNPRAVIRSWTNPAGNPMEQRYVHGEGWKFSSLRDDIGRGRENGDTVLITEEAAERLIERSRPQ